MKKISSFRCGLAIFQPIKALAAVLPRRSIGLVDMFQVNCMQLEVLRKTENKNYVKRHDIVQKKHNLKDNKKLNNE